MGVKFEGGGGEGQTQPRSVFGLGEKSWNKKFEFSRGRDINSAARMQKIKKEKKGEKKECMKRREVREKTNGYRYVFLPSEITSRELNHQALAPLIKK